MTAVCGLLREALMITSRICKFVLDIVTCGSFCSLQGGQRKLLPNRNSKQVAEDCLRSVFGTVQVTVLGGCFGVPCCTAHEQI